MINESSGNNVRNHSVLDKNHQQRIEHFRFIRRGQSTAQYERRHISESDFTDQIFIKIVSPNENTVKLGLADTGHDFRLLFCHGSSH